MLSVCNLSVEEVIGGWSLASQPSLLDEFHTSEKPYQEIRWTVPKEWHTWLTSGHHTDTHTHMHTHACMHTCICTHMYPCTRVPEEFKHAFDQAVKSNFIKPGPLCGWLLILCLVTGAVCVKCCYCPHILCFLPRSTCRQLLLFWAEWTSPSLEHRFYFKEWLTDTPWLFRLGYLLDIFSKMNEASLSLQGEQLTVYFCQW